MPHRYGATLRYGYAEQIAEHHYIYHICACCKYLESEHIDEKCHYYLGRTVTELFAGRGYADLKQVFKFFDWKPLEYVPWEARYCGAEQYYGKHSHGYGAA